MHLVDPIKQPQRFIQQADALVRQSMAEPGAADPFAVIDAHLEASFEQVLANFGAPDAPEPKPEPQASKDVAGERRVAAHVEPQRAAQMAQMMAPMPAYGAQMGVPGMMPGMMPGMVPGMTPGMMPYPMMAPGAMLPYGGMFPGTVDGVDQAVPMRPMLPVIPPAPPAVPHQHSALPSAELEAMIGEMSARHDVPAWLIRNVIRTESGGNPGATSPVGAMGLMQLMPGTARDLGVADPYDARQNMDGGVRYLKQMLGMFGGDYTKAVAAYNAGPGNVQRYQGVPPFAETQAYVQRVLG